MAIPFLACMVSVAAFYHLPPSALPAIQAVEAGQVGLAHVNRDGSQDLGLMQVNSRWLQPLATVTGMPVAFVRFRLVYDGCFNVAAAGAILRTCLDEARGNLMLAVGYYHSHRARALRAYQVQVLRSATALSGAGRRAPPPEGPP